MLWAFASAAAGWSSTVVVFGAALTGLVLRRLWKGAPLTRRLRPHYAVGYAALALALIHVYFAMGTMRSADPGGIRYAAVALGALALQTFVGASLQDPGAYRRPLRAWHLSVFAAIVAFVALHVMANGGPAL